MTGIAIAVWQTDGKLKYRLYSDQDELEKYIQQMKERVSPHLWNVFFIGHDMTFNALKGEDQL